MTDVTLDVYLYGELARYAEKPGYHGFANIKITIPESSKLFDVLAYLHIPTEQRGITFINGKLSALPGLQLDLDFVMNTNDRVAFFDLKSMWPFQYRDGATMTDEMARILANKNKGLHHTYDES